MTTDIKALAKRVGASNPYTDPSDIVFEEHELIEYTRLIRQQAFEEAAQAAEPDGPYEEEGWWAAKVDSVKRIRSLKA